MPTTPTTPEGYLPVEAYTSTELHQMLVADAVKGHATYLPWAVSAYKRIGERTGRGSEDAFQAVLDEVESLTGLRRMPVSTGVSDAELKAMGL